jgi:hypothetical protein
MAMNPTTQVNSKHHQTTQPKPQTMNLEKDILMWRRINRFYKTGDNLNRLLHQILFNPDISLSLLDWVITIYARQKEISLRNTGSFIPFDIYVEYKTTLKGLKKEYFDIFCRYDLVSYEFPEFVADGGCGCEGCTTKSITTTVGQLNICMWIIETGILDYVLDGSKSLTRKMSKYMASKTKPASLKSKPGVTKMTDHDASQASAKTNKLVKTRKAKPQYDDVSSSTSSDNDSVSPTVECSA